MNTQESCRAAEEQIREIQKMLGPETMDQCVAELERIAATLATLAADGPHSEMESFLKIKQAANGLQAHVEHASNFWSGLLQMRMGSGYNDRGLPMYRGTEARSCFEG